MPLYYCDIQGCREPAERYCGACDLCGRHVCVAHVDKDHNCPGASVEGVGVMKAIEKMWIEDVQRLNARIDLEALCQHASTLRDGIPCSTLPVLVKESMAIGHKNWHFPITFDDGVVWLCRTPHTTARAAPPVIQDRILLSEFATYRFLSSIDVPVPAVFGVAVSSPTNAVGVSYLLMEKVPGKWVDWDTAGVEGKERIMEQIADVYIKIKAHPFPSIGALLDTSSGDTMFPGPFVERGLCNLDDDGNATTIGPFSTTLDYFKGVLQHKLDLIVRREIMAKSAVDGYLLYRFLLDNVSSLPPVKNATDGEFYLVHGGSKADNILADEGYTITGIIDWECSEVLPASSAFSAPLFLMDWHRVDNGRNDSSEGEKRLAEMLEAKGHPDLARRVLETRFENYWVFGVQSDGWIGPRSALGMLKLCGEECGGSVDEAGWAAWKEKIMHRYADDVGLQSLLRGP